MPKFSGPSQASQLDWRFSTGAQGTVPEPTTEQVGTFFEQLADIINREQDLKEVTLATLASVQRELADEKVVGAYADLCSHQPSIEQLMALPHRERSRFFDWITTEVVNPT